MIHFVSNFGLAPIIDDDTEDPVGCGKGWLRRDFSLEPHGSLPFCSAFEFPTIPRSEWVERIKTKEKTKSRISDIADQAGVKIKNQGNTNFCWCNAPVTCLELIRAVQGEPYVELSPASVACPINGFVNQGGWGTRALKYLMEHGAVPSRLWPSNAISREFDDAEANAERKKFRVSEWYDLEPGNFDQLATALLLGFPTAIGLSWWSHEVTAVELVKLDGDGRFGVLIQNSWGYDYGDRGRAVLTERKATPDDAVAPRSAVVS